MSTWRPWHAADVARTELKRAKEKVETDPSLAKGLIIMAEENLQNANQAIEEVAEELKRKG